MPYFKFTNTVDGDEDAVFVEADNEESAQSVFADQIGDVPRSMLKIEEVSNLPDGEEAISA